MQQPQTVTSKSYIGLFLVTLVTLMFEIMLTRVFSVTMWYHYAFMAISVAMFGMTVGALVVYLKPNHFTAERAKEHMARHSLLFGLAIIACFFLYLMIPWRVGGGDLEWLWMPLAYITVAIPFIFSGIVVTLALTKFERQVSRLYAVDLAGAAVGCLGILVVLVLTDIYTAIIFCGLVCFIAALYFAKDAGSSPQFRQILVGLTLVVGVFCVINTGLARKQQGLISLTYIKDHDVATAIPPVYEKWTSYSRVSIIPLPEGFPLLNWGFGSNFDPSRWQRRQMMMLIDSTAGTVLTEFDGEDLEPLGYLKYDITNLAHHVRPDSRTLVVGVGGGRDILAALAFDQPSVVGVELNAAIIKAITRVPAFVNFTGDLGRHPRVRLVIDEARAYVARTPAEYDILMVSLIDTWAATAAGAFALSENALYTREAWGLFLDRLSDDGILTFSRWWSDMTPYESLRTVALATAALRDRGIEDPRQHILMAKAEQPLMYNDDLQLGVANVLVSPTPFSEEAVRRFEEAAERHGFDIVISPTVIASIDALPGEQARALERLLTDPDPRDFIRAFPVNIAAPTDNNPFFFNMLRPRDIFRPSEVANRDALTFNYTAVQTLVYLAFTVVLLTAFCILLPLVLSTKRGGLKGATPFFLYFIGIGLGFMLIEIALLQRFIIFLGHPTYALAVVLFTVLLSSGLGSYLTDKLDPTNLRMGGLVRLGALIAVAFVMGLIFDPASRALEGNPTIVRAGAAAAMLFPLGLFMGMCFPIGMKLAQIRFGHLTPWLWGLNGAASVTASVLAVLIALAYTIPTAYWTGFVAYLLVIGSFLYLAKREL